MTFICESCWRERTSDSFWWDFSLHSRGPCEVCNKAAVCADVHSQLPTRAANSQEKRDAS